ncbi:MAG TPA: GAF domain-containing sensor histidine kinase [Anaerolineae bacterium]|nr:GAF domain-containing sensor histidine kinase [Anaerolineae bacterium]
MTLVHTYQTADLILRQHNRELALLNKVGRELTAMLEFDKLIEHLLQAVTETLGAEGASLWMWTEAPPPTQQLACRGFWNLLQDCMIPIALTLSAGQGVAGWVALQGQSLAVADVAQDDRFYAGVDKLSGLQTRSLLAVPLQGREGVIGVLEIMNKKEGDFTQDITLVETLAASAAIALENAMLVEELRKRTAELQARNEELDAFAHAAAHDLQNPLGRIVGFAEVLEQTFETLSPTDLQHYLELIARNGRKMGKIIDALLLLAIVRHEDIQKTPLDMAAIVNEAVEGLHDEAKATQAVLVLPQRWPTALGYAPWVEEVWANYLSNALKYGGRPDEGIAPHVELGFTRPEDMPSTAEDDDSLPNRNTKNQTPRSVIRFWVRDNGQGLTPEEKLRLFKPFERLNRAHAKGHGLGLSIVLRIVHKLGGEVGIESQVGQGSCFWFTLPTVFPATETL